MIGRPTENPKDEFEKIKENFLHFLDRINEKHLDGKMSDDARFKNIHLFNMFVKIIKDTAETGNEKLIKELLKKHNIKRILKTEFDTEVYMKNHKAELQTAKYYLLPDIKMENSIFDKWTFEVNGIIILEKKNDLRSAWQKIWERIMWLLPGKEPVKA